MSRLVALLLLLLRSLGFSPLPPFLTAPPSPRPPISSQGREGEFLFFSLSDMGKDIGGRGERERERGNATKKSGGGSGERTDGRRSL